MNLTCFNELIRKIGDCSQSSSLSEYLPYGYQSRDKSSSSCHGHQTPLHAHAACAHARGPRRCDLSDLFSPTPESLFKISAKDAAKVVLQSPLQNWTLWSQEGERFCMVCSYKLLQLLYTFVINYQKHIGCVSGGKPMQTELVSSRGEFRFLLVIF